MESKIRQAIAEGKQGFYIGDRLILPFKCQIIKIIANSEIFTEMVGGKNIKLQQDPLNTSIYLRSIGKLSNFMGTYKVIKLVVCDLDSELTDIQNHIKLICEMGDNHKIDIHEPTDDMIFIE